MSRRKKLQTLSKRYPPSEPCDCAVCTAFCQRPGWWTVPQAARAIEAGYAHRMMLEMAPESEFGVLSPAFTGNEGLVALEEHAQNGCAFLKDTLCELHGTGHKPLECRFAHHKRLEAGKQCHVDVERDWKSPEGKALVNRWIGLMILSGKSPFV